MYDLKIDENYVYVCNIFKKMMFKRIKFFHEQFKISKLFKCLIILRY